MIQTALVTGASSGIGTEFAKLLAAEGYNIVVVARREQRLLELKKEIQSSVDVEVTTLAVDLADRNAAQYILESLNEKGISIDLLVSNAGYSLSGKFHERDISDYVDLVQVNSLTPMALAHGLIPAMLRKGCGKMLFVSSVAGGLYGGVGHGVYIASKAFLIRLGLSLNEEYKDCNIGISVMLPGIVATDFHQRAGTEELQKKSPKFAIKTAGDVAGEGLTMLSKGIPYKVVGMVNRVMLILVKLLPVGLGLKLTKS